MGEVKEWLPVCHVTYEKMVEPDGLKLLLYKKAYHALGYGEQARQRIEIMWESSVRWEISIYK